MTLFAPGIADKFTYGDISTLPVDLPITLVRQLHSADKAGLHLDLRIGTPSGMFSWAVPKSLPLDNLKHLAIRQPLHSWAYNEFQGRLGHGYGKGIVTRKLKSPIVILKRSPNHIMFTRGDSKDAPIYNLVQTHDKSWLVSIKKQDQPAVIKHYTKLHFKSIPILQAALLILQGAYVTPKIDGAGALAYLGPKGISVYGIRPDKNNNKPLYTDIIGNLRGAAVPELLQGTVLRGLLYGTKQNRVISANQLSGILNSTVLNAVNKRKAEGIQLLLAALAINKDGKDVYNSDLLNKTVHKLNNPFVSAIKQYKGQEAKQLLTNIISKKDPLTQLGVVVQQDNKRPLKAKLLQDNDVIVRRIFKALAKNDNRAGGFLYSLPNSNKIVGRVGTGFSHSTLRDMLKHPLQYIGRTARITSQEQYPSGAYRAPRFISIKED